MASGMKSNNNQETQTMTAADLNQQIETARANDAKHREETKTVIENQKTEAAASTSPSERKDRSRWLFAAFIVLVIITIIGTIGGFAAGLMSWYVLFTVGFWASVKWSLLAALIGIVTQLAAYAMQQVYKAWEEAKQAKANAHMKTVRGEFGRAFRHGNVRIIKTEAQPVC